MPSDDLLNMSEISQSPVPTPLPHSAVLYETYRILYRPGREGQNIQTFMCPGMAQLANWPALMDKILGRKADEPQDSQIYKM